MAEAIDGYIFYEIAALLVLAAGVGFVGLLLRQPLIVSFIAVGILAGPSVLDIAKSDEHIDLLAELGIAVLLFLVGLKLDLKLVRTLGPVALMTGLGQVIFTTVFGFLIGLALGLGPVTSLYVAVALTFSSTIIIVKLLTDKREIDSLHGRIALG
ncbi:MAG: cation:proton antiporter, partial [Pseudomonadota bacterium]